MFRDNYNLEKVNVRSLNTKNVKNMDYMFFGCQELRKLELINFEISNLTDAYYIFGEDHIDYSYIRNFSLKHPYNEYNFFRLVIYVK